MANAALAGALGLDAWGHLSASSVPERIARHALLLAAVEADEVRQENLAVLIANAVGQALGG